MRAIDTNLIIRYLTGDNTQQAARAREVIDGGAVFVSLTVLLEAEWVLRSLYNFARAPLAQALRGFAGLPTVTIETPSICARALDQMATGLDFADALHLAKAEGCTDFVTFDKNFARAANKLGGIKVSVL